MTQAITCNSFEEPDLRTLAEATEYFSNPSHCLTLIAARRWPDGPVKCPVCDSKKVRFLATRGLWQCNVNHSKSQFSVRSGTLLEDSHISLTDWLLGIWIVANSKAPVSSYQLSAKLGITQKSAWYMLRRMGGTLQIKQQSVAGINQDLYGSDPRPHLRKNDPGE
jgi:Transposase zinc-ribbon domain